MVGALGVILAVILYFIIPPVKQKDQKMSDGGTQLTIKGVTKVAVLNKGFNYCIHTPAESQLVFRAPTEQPRVWGAPGA